MPDDIETGLPPGAPENTEGAGKENAAESPFQTQKEKLKEITDGIEKGIKNLFASGEYKDYLKTMARFHNYSLNNIILIFTQKPDATMVAGFSKWKDQFGRHVNRGEKGIKIIAPVLYNKKVEREKRDPLSQMIMVDDSGNPIMEEITIRVPRFKVTSVFDVSQTDGKPLPTLVHDIYGSVKDYDVFMEAIRRSSPVPMDIVLMDEKEHGDGYFSRIENHTYIREGMSQVQTVSASIHEMAHAMLHTREALEAAKLENPEAKPKTKAQIEVEAESVSYAVCQYYGIETKENSFGYIASWSKNQELPELKASLETISKTASAIITSIDRNLKEIAREQEPEQQKQEQPKETIAEVPEDQEVPFLSDSVSITPAGLLTPDYGVEITREDMEAYGYYESGMMPLTREKAYVLFDQDAAIFALYQNGSADMLVDRDEITNSSCAYFGVEYDDWVNTPDYKDLLAQHIVETSQLEHNFLTKMKEPAIMIYQILPESKLYVYQFMPLEQLKAHGVPLDRQSYEPIYAMTVPTTETSPDKLLEGTFHMFNMNRPDDFKGHSMSVSDIIALKLNGEVSFHYVDSFGFKRLDGFLPDNPLKNAEMTVEDDFGMIDGIINNGRNPALEPPRQEELPTAPELPAQAEEPHKQEFPSILERLNSPQPARAAPKKDSPKKKIGMEL
ncbi:MAG: DUF4316 domain-containing protein [Clostridia bacterium]|nr:DUF4316 domain-containing protein [Clostridia bacterium]